MEDVPRYQPEFSTGERLAHVEATLGALDRRFADSEHLFDEKLNALRRELQVGNEAQDKAITKAEEATSRELKAITDGIDTSRKESSESSDRYRREVARRIETLEQSTTEQASAIGATERTTDRYKASTLGYWAVGAAFVGTGITVVLVEALK